MIAIITINILAIVIIIIIIIIILIINRRAIITFKAHGAMWNWLLTKNFSGLNAIRAKRFQRQVIIRSPL